MTEKKYHPSVYDPKTIKHVRILWLGCLLELSDIELQKERWLNKRITNPHWTYTEFMSGYFDDALWDFGYEEMVSCGYVTTQEYEIVRAFHEALDAYQEPSGDYSSHEDILNDPKWQEIVFLGHTTMKKLQLLLSDKDELKLFENYITCLTIGDFVWGRRGLDFWWHKLIWYFYDKKRQN